MSTSSSWQSFRVVFVCFFLSGFTGLLYQTIWLRMAMANFGVNSSVIATVITVFMLGLAIGTALGGSLGREGGELFHLNGLNPAVSPPGPGVTEYCGNPNIET